MEREEYLTAFRRGELSEGWRFFGAHREGELWRFRVWAPNARAVSVVGEFNGWNADTDPMMGQDGIWEAWLPGPRAGQLYQYAVLGCDGVLRYKTDPYAFAAELRPGTAGRLTEERDFPWRDERFRRERREVYGGPLNIYEVHLGSWRRREDGGFLSYRELGEQLADYVCDMGYTAVELLPVTEHPLDESWGYQCTGYFAPTSRFGTPEDFRWLVDHLHRKGIAVLLDWVPSHFCKDAHGLISFDGSPCYEYGDPNKMEHAGWGTRAFDLGRGEVVSFLLSSARFWLEEYHIDGLRVDAVASMLYLDYGRGPGQWTPNLYGGRENLEAVDFLRRLNTMAFSVDPRVLMIAEESTAWPMVSRPAEMGGLGFNLKWNMGWMNDICHYLKMDPWFRQFHHKDITFSLMYAFSENFILPISHDEVVYMKGSLVNKMPGDYPQQLRCLRGFYCYFLAHPGKKLLFMGAEIGQWHEWNSAAQLDWYLLDQERNRQVRDFFREANRFYRRTAALWEIDFDWAGFEWLVADDNHNNVAVFLRRDKRGRELLCAVNFSPNAYQGYRVGVTAREEFVPVLNSDDVRFGGGGFGDTEPVAVERVPSHGREQSLCIRIPPFGGVFYQGRGRLPRRKRKGAEA